jgi:signal transduction histidine kinase
MADFMKTTNRPPWLHAIGNRLFGSPSSVDLEHRILNGIMFLGFVTGAITTINSLCIGASQPKIVAGLMATVGALIAYWISLRTRHWHMIPAPAFLYFLAVLAFLWVSHAGSFGTTSYYFFLLACCAVLLFKNVGKLVFLGLTAGTAASLLLIEYLFPSIILPYANLNQRFIDVAFAMILCLLVAATFIHVVYREYQRERKAKDELLYLATVENEHTQRSMREKQRLLTVVCHDIANALMVLQGEIEMIQRAHRISHPGEPFPAEPRLERMGYACNNIGEIISSVRMMEAVEQESIPFSLSPVELQSVFRNAEVIFSKRLSQRRMRIELPELDDDVQYVMGEPKIFANHVFNNLISNAIKFSYPDSTIVVQVARQADETRIYVIDQGIGIPANLMANLFNLEAKTTRPGIDGEPGTGFGMRTVKSFVDLFGGHIEITSRPENEYPVNHGTTVCIRLKSVQA